MLGAPSIVPEVGRRLWTPRAFALQLLDPQIDGTLVVAVHNQDIVGKAIENA